MVVVDAHAIDKPQGRRGARRARAKTERLTSNAFARAQLQIASPGDKIEDAIDGAYAEATTVRGFLEHASELRQALGLRDGDDTIKVMVAALDETEKAIGKALAMDNAQGMAQYGTAVAKAAEAAGIKPLDAAAMDKLKDEVDYEAIEGELAELQAVADEVNAEKV